MMCSELQIKAICDLTDDDFIVLHNDYYHLDGTFAGSTTLEIYLSETLHTYPQINGVWTLRQKHLMKWIFIEDGKALCGFEFVGINDRAGCLLPHIRSGNVNDSSLDVKIVDKKTGFIYGRIVGN